MLKYSVSIKWSDEDGGFIATIPELPGLSAFGETKEEANSELSVAADAYLESLRDAGQTIPAPEKLSRFSGQTRVRMPKSLHAKLSESAKNEGVSLNTYIVSLLSERQAEEEASSKYGQMLEAIRGNQSTILSMMSDTLSLPAGADREIDSISSSSESFTARRNN